MLDDALSSGRGRAFWWESVVGLGGDMHGVKLCG